MRQIQILLFCLLLAGASKAQSPGILQIRDYRQKNEQQILAEFHNLLSIPNTANDSVKLVANAEMIQQMMRNRGISNVQLLTPGADDAPPVVYGEVMTPGVTNTIMFYAHYDGQPVDSSQWDDRVSPFIPKYFTSRLDQGATEIEKLSFPTDPSWRIYARGSSDDKAGVVAILNAYSAIISSGKKPTCNIKFIFEGEEEKGSPHFAAILQKYKSLLKSDLWIICDGPVHQTGKKQIVFGVRGETGLDLTVYGSNRPLHSGHYGNWAPNPAMMLAKLLATMKDENGMVTVKGFYDDVTPLTLAEKKALKELPPIDEQMMRELGISRHEITGRNLYEAVLMPSLNIRGMQSANIGNKASNIIPTTATASIDMRLVPGNDCDRQQLKLIEHIKKQGYRVMDREPTNDERARYDKIAKVTRKADYNAMRTPIDDPIARKVSAAVKSTTNDNVLLVPSMGGSLPLIMIKDYLGAKILILPIANHDNNQHAENENLRLANLWEGIESLASVMLMP